MFRPVTRGVNVTLIPVLMYWNESVPVTVVVEVVDWVRTEICLPELKVAFWFSTVIKVGCAMVRDSSLV